MAAELGSDGILHLWCPACFHPPRSRRFSASSSRIRTSARGCSAILASRSFSTRSSALRRASRSALRSASAMARASVSPMRASRSRSARARSPSNVAMCRPVAGSCQASRPCSQRRRMFSAALYPCGVPSPTHSCAPGLHRLKEPVPLGWTGGIICQWVYGG